MRCVDLHGMDAGSVSAGFAVEHRHTDQASSFAPERQCALTPIAFVRPDHKSEENTTEGVWGSGAGFMQHHEVRVLMLSGMVVIWFATRRIASWCMGFVRPMTP